MQDRPTPRFKQFLIHYFPQLFLISSLVVLAFTSVEFYRAQTKGKVVKAVPLANFRSLDRIPIMIINGKTIGVLGVEQAKKGRRARVWIKNMQTHKVKRFKIGQEIYRTNVRLGSIRPDRLELRSKSGVHHLLFRH